MRLLAGYLGLPVMAMIGCNYAQSKTGLQNLPGKKDKRGDLIIGDYCDECDTMFEGMPAINAIPAVTSIATIQEPGERLLLNGIIYHPDGKTPAADIILYIWHTDANGYYKPSQHQKEGKRNGHLRGWVKTGMDGRFTINSIRPAAYPGRNIPVHIHLLVKEPGKTLYYIDEVWFDDDPLVTSSLRKEATRRGSDLIIHPTKSAQGIWEGTLSITLGLNIPNYK